MADLGTKVLGTTHEVWDASQLAAYVSINIHRRLLHKYATIKLLLVLVCIFDLCRDFMLITT